MSEHRTIAPEISFLADERDTMRVEEGMIVGGLKDGDPEVRGRAASSCTSTSRSRRRRSPSSSSPRSTSMLEKLGHELPEDQDLDRESEKLLTEYVKKRVRL